MKRTILCFGFSLFACLMQGQTSGNTSPGSINPSNVTDPTPVQSPTLPAVPLPPANNGFNNPTGTGGTDMTNPNLNGSYESNPDGRPRDNFQSNPNTVPSATRQPKPEK